MFACMTCRPSASHFIATGAVVLASLSLAALPAMAQHSGHDSAPNAAPHTQPRNDPAKDIKSDPYPLDTCPVSGKKLGSMGDAVVKTYDSREVRFCCGGCVKKFEGDKAGYWKKVDEEIVKAQMPFYPLTDCPIQGGKLGSMGEPVNYVYNNRLVRFCCEDCLPKFLNDPKPTLAKLDEAVLKQQREHYPIATCLVSDEAFGGDMGEPIDRVYNNHLIRFCCKGCVKDFEKTPAKFLSILDEAWKKQGGMPGEIHAGNKGGQHEDGHGDR